MISEPKITKTNIVMVLVFAFLLSSCASITERMVSWDTDTRESAIEEVKKMDAESKAKLVPALIEALKNKNGCLDKVIWALGEIGPSAKDAVPALVEVKSSKGGHLFDADDALVKIGHAAVPSFIAALKEKDITVRHNAIRSLGKIRPPAKDAIPYLIETLKDEYDDKSAAEALEKIGTDAVPALIKALKNKDGIIPHWSTEILGKIGPAAKNAVPAIIERLNNKYSGDPDAIVAIRRVAAEALEKIGTPDATKAIISYEKILAYEKAKAKPELERKIIKAIAVYRSALRVYNAMKDDLNYHTLSKDIPGKAAEIQKYATDTVSSALRHLNNLMIRYGEEYGAAAVRDLAIQNGFLDLLR